MTKSQYLHQHVHKWALSNFEKNFISKTLVFFSKIVKFNFFYQKGKILWRILWVPVVLLLSSKFSCSQQSEFFFPWDHDRGHLANSLKQFRSVSGSRSRSVEGRSINQPDVWSFKISFSRVGVSGPASTPTSSDSLRNTSLRMSRYGRTCTLKLNGFPFSWESRIIKVCTVQCH